jgi:hypothetical protein
VHYVGNWNKSKGDEMQNFDWETPVEDDIRSTEAFAWRIILKKILRTMWGSRLELQSFRASSNVDNFLAPGANIHNCRN